MKNYAAMSKLTVAIILQGLQRGLTKFDNEKQQNPYFSLANILKYVWIKFEHRFQHVV